MPRNITQPTSDEIEYAAQEYLPFLPDALREKIEAILEQTHSGVKVDNDILLLMSEDEDARRWMKQALFHHEHDTLKSGYDPLAGAPDDIPANSLWQCPQCGWEWRVLRKGRPVPYCPKDHSMLKHKK